MAEETIQQEQQAEPQGEAKETDWKAEARKWEARAKKSAQAEQELAELKKSQMTEQEREKARADKAEQELAELKARAQHDADAGEIAKRDGIPASLLAFCADREAMEAFATAYKAEQPVVHAAASANTQRIVKSGGEKSDTRTQFAEFIKAKLEN